MVLDEVLIKFAELEKKSTYLKECLWLSKVKRWIKHKKARARRTWFLEQLKQS